MSYEGVDSPAPADPAAVQAQGAANLGIAMSVLRRDEDLVTWLSDRLLAIAQPVLAQLRDITGESAQLYRPHADTRICVAAAERTSGLRDTVPVGAALPMTAGSAAQVLLAWEEGGRMHRGLRGAKFTAITLAQVRRRGWAATAAEREPGVASVSAPVRGPGGRVIAAVSVSGPIERLTRSPGRLHAGAVVAAGEKISRLLRAEY